jgi:hypothetical protein
VLKKSALRQLRKMANVPILRVSDDLGYAFKWNPERFQRRPIGRRRSGGRVGLSPGKTTSDLPAAFAPRPLAMIENWSLQICHWQLPTLCPTAQLPMANFQFSILNRLYCQGRTIDDRGVRPSSGAASPDGAGATKFSKAYLHSHVAAPGDGRTPPL